MSGYGLVTGGYRCFRGCKGVDLCGSLLVMSVSGVVISGYQWLRVFLGCFWVVMGGNGW